MSILLQAQLMRLLPFAGVPSYDRQIDALRMELEPRGGIEVLAAELDALEDEVEDLELNGMVVDRSFGAQRLIYVDALNGDDANDGASEVNSIKTCARMVELLNRIDACVVYIRGELVFDRRIVANGYINRIQFNGLGEGAAMRFVDVGNSVAGFVKFAGGQLVLENLTLIDDTTNSFWCFYGVNGSNHIELNSVNIVDGDVKIASGKASPLMHYIILDLVVNAVTISAESGRLLRSVPAGGNPNDVRGIRSNTTVLG